MSYTIFTKKELQIALTGLEKRNPSQQKNNITKFKSIAYALILLPLSSYATNNASILQELQLLKEKTVILEQKLANINNKVKKVEENSEQSLMSKTQFNGVLNVNIQSIDNPSGANNQEDISIGDLELNISHAISDKYGMSILIKKKDDTDIDNKVYDLEIDKAVLNYHADNFDITAGKTTLPFGSYDSGMVSDPLTLELGEAGGKNSIIASILAGDFNISGYVFNGDFQGDKSTNAKLNNYGFSIGYEKENLMVGLDYMNSISEGGALSDKGGTNSFVAGVALKAKYDFGNGLAAYAEQIKAQNKFDDTGSAATAGVNDKISATHYELSYAHNAFGKEATVFLSKSTVNDDSTGQVGLAESRTGLGYSVALDDGVSLNVETIEDKAFNNDKTRTNTIQWSHEF